MSSFTTGDSRPYPMQLTINDQPFEIPISSVVKAQIISSDKKKVLSSSPAICLSSDTDADWATSKVSVKFPREATASIRIQGDALLEVQVTLGSGDSAEDWSWFIPIELEKGHIVE